jgi:hypothetical protein
MAAVSEVPSTPVTQSFLSAIQTTTPPTPAQLAIVAPTDIKAFNIMTPPQQNVYLQILNTGTTDVARFYLNALGSGDKDKFNSILLDVLTGIQPMTALTGFIQNFTEVPTVTPVLLDISNTSSPISQGFVTATQSTIPPAAADISVVTPADIPAFNTLTPTQQNVYVQLVKSSATKEASLYLDTMTSTDRDAFNTIIAQVASGAQPTAILTAFIENYTAAPEATGAQIPYIQIDEQASAAQASAAQVAAEQASAAQASAAQAPTIEEPAEEEDTGYGYGYGDRGYGYGARGYGYGAPGYGYGSPGYGYGAPQSGGKVRKPRQTKKNKRKVSKSSKKSRKARK